MLINVTADDIVNGMQGDCVRCPIANAIARVSDKEFRVSSRCVLVEGKYLMLPDRAINFIARFDYSGHGEPFSFKMDL